MLQPLCKKIQFILNLVIITLHNRWHWWLPRKLLSKPQVLKTLNDISMSKITTFVHFDPIPWLGVTFTFPSLCRAATLVRRTKGENRRGRSHPLRCGRQRWYGGTRGGDTGGVSGEAAPHAVTTPGHHTLHIPPHTHTPCHNISFFSDLFLSFLTSSLTPVVYFLLWWTDLCMPLLAQQSDQYYGLFLVFFAKLHDLSAERWSN